MTLRTAALAVALTGVLTTGAPPAHAEGAIAFFGTVQINCFGCGPSNASMDVALVGEAQRWLFLGDPGYADLQVTSAPNSLCQVNTVLQGRLYLSDKAEVDVLITVTGAVATISTWGAVNGLGAAVFSVTSPVGNPCGQPITATISGTFAGT